MTQRTCLTSGDRGGISLVVLTISELMRKKTSDYNCPMYSLYQWTTIEGLSITRSMFSRLLFEKQKTVRSRTSDRLNPHSVSGGLAFQFTLKNTT
jgi:hypothetical protein